MKNSIFGWARNSDQAHLVIDHLKQIGISDISVVQPSAPQSNPSAYSQPAAGQNLGQNPKKPTNPNEKAHTDQTHPQHGQNYNQQPAQKASANLPNSNISLKSLNIPSQDMKKFEENQKAGQFLIAVQSDNTEKLDKAQDLFKKEGLRDITSTIAKAKAH
ncbi:MAG: hypothetical protein WC222_01935 [Parachlamydiales bacterium]|jgi:hypothetical protein